MKTIKSIFFRFILPFMGFMIGWFIMDLCREYASYKQLYEITLKGSVHKSIKIDSLESKVEYYQNQLKQCKQTDTLENPF